MIGGARVAFLLQQIPTVSRSLLFGGTEAAGIKVSSLEQILKVQVTIMVSFESTFPVCSRRRVCLLGRLTCSAKAISVFLAHSATPFKFSHVVAIKSLCDKHNSIVSF